MLLEVLWNIVFHINWCKFFGMTKGVACGNLIRILSLFPFPFETFHIKVWSPSFIVFMRMQVAYLWTTAVTVSLSLTYLKECVWGEARMWWAAELPRLLGSTLGSLTEITAGEQLCPCTAGSVSSDQTQREEAQREGKKKWHVFPFLFSQPTAGRQGSCSAETQPFPLQQD